VSEFIPVNEPRLVGKEAEYLAECIHSGWVSSEGPFVSRFENEFAEMVGTEFGIAVSNGSAALDVAVAALRLGPGDEVIVPTFSIISCVSAIVRAGATPVLVDCAPDSFNADPDQIVGLITARTRAIMVVHTYGLPVDMAPILEIAKRFNLSVIEDAAEAIGQSYGGRKCGSFGIVSVFSFYANKHITTGEGGMLVTDDSEIAERCRLLRNLAFEPERRFVHRELGWNCRMTNLQAAVGVAQLENLDSALKRKREIGLTYSRLLADVEVLELPPIETPFAENLFWVFGVVLRNDFSPSAADVMSALKAQGIGTRPFFWPAHEQPVFQDMGLFVGETHPRAERLARRGFYLPSGLAITDRQLEKVSIAVRAAVLT
jgi:perosamine synthetase